jgi:predicted CoA-binding protein
MQDNEWMANLIDDDDDLRRILERSKRVAILGIKPEERSAKPAHYVPRYLQDAGYQIVPVPVYYPEVEAILGEPVFRTVSAVPGTIDLVIVFRRAEHIPPHLPDLLAKRPPAVWFQLGIRNDEVAEQLARVGIAVVQDRCAMVEHRRLVRR